MTTKKYYSISRIRFAVRFIRGFIFLYILSTMLSVFFIFLYNLENIFFMAFSPWSIIGWFIQIVFLIVLSQAFAATEEHLLYLRNKYESND